MCYTLLWVMWHLSKCQTSTCNLSTLLSKFFKHLHTPVRRSGGISNSTAVITLSVVETINRLGSFLSAVFSRPRANFLHRTCIAGLVKHLSSYTGRILEWMAFGWSFFAHRKQITQCHSLWDAFSSNVAVVFLRMNSQPTVMLLQQNS